TSSPSRRPSSHPRPSTLLRCTNTSLLPSVGSMKPKPFSALNHLTFPLVMVLQVFLSTECINHDQPEESNQKNLEEPTGIEMWNQRGIKGLVEQGKHQERRKVLWRIHSTRHAHGGAAPIEHVRSTCTIAV